MALKKTLAQRLFNMSKIWNQNCRLSSPSSAAQSRIPQPQAKLAPDPGTSRRFLQWRPLSQSAAVPTEIRLLPRGEKLLEKLRAMDIGRDRIRLDGLSPPPAKTEEAQVKLTVEDARKLLKVLQLEIIKSKLRKIPRENILLEEFFQICSETCGNREQGLEFSKMLDESGTVIVLGKFVFLRPEQETETIVAPDLKRVKGSTFQTVALGFERPTSKD